MNFIEELSQKRQRWIESSKENNFEEGIKNLLTELYPENAHFIYELLQNAEDTQATKVKFVLDFQGLSFQHNGKQQFTEIDIDSITGIGNTPKKGDVRKIGEFGVGFKAVFGYTNNPRIYSGKWSFEIHDLVCPKTIDQIPEITESKSTATYFRFPFNHLQKSEEVAFEEIKKTIENLPPNTILFLQNIEEIHWEIEKDGKQTGFIKRSKMQKPNCFEIKKKTDKLHKTYWLRFTKKIPQKKNLSVAIAFCLIPEKTKRDSKKVNYKIDGEVQKGDVSIFFPAEKETSNLRFYLHAPFAATVARDSIRTQADNLELRDLLVELLVESLPKIKRLGLLNENFLTILPNSKDELSDFYAPFREKVVEVFQNEDFTPTWNNKFSSAKNLIQAESEIKSTINKNNILNNLFENQNIDWVIDTEKSSRQFDFLEQLEIKKLTWKELLEKVSKLFSTTETADSILSKQSDKWMQDFYALLAKAKENYRFSYYPRVESASIIRLKNGTHKTADNSYFQTDLVQNNNEISIVKSETYQLNEKAKKFLKDLGVKDFSEKEEIKLILEQYYKNELEVSEKENLKHLERFIKFWNNNQNDFSIFTDYKFLKTQSGEAQIYCKPSEIFIDEPYEKTYLSAIEKFNFYGRNLWKGYYSKIKNKETFIQFLKKIGVKCCLEITSSSISESHPDYKTLKQDLTKGARETSTSTNKDYNIQLLTYMLPKVSIDVSRLIWKTISEAEKNVLKARFKANKKSDERVADSQLVHTLRKFAWIPDKDGKFYKPENIKREFLSKNFPFNDSNGWLTAIGFGNPKETNQLDTQQRLERFAKQLGLTIPQARKAIEFAKMSDDEKTEFEEFTKQRKQKNKGSKNSSAESGNSTGSVTGANQTSNPENTPNNESSPYIPNYEIEYLVKSRPYQRDFKNRLKSLENRCRVTGITNIEFLIASHIKPVSDCTNAEKVDENNGFLLSPHVDKLFDKGWISFTDEGEILCANNEVKEIMKIWGLEINKSVGTFNEKQKEYLAYHRRKVFKSES